MSSPTAKKAVLSISGNVVRLVLNGEEDDPVEYEPFSNLEEKGEIESVIKANGRPPNGVNMRALLNCNGGTIKFRDVEYDTEKGW